jgi:predicted small lipoprotein YifL
MSLSYTAVMRIALTLVIMILATACGQTGSLYLPDESIETPVEIRTQPTPPAPEAPQSDPDKKEEKKDTQPPGG